MEGWYWAGGANCWKEGLEIAYGFTFWGWVWNVESDD